jgi:hypothetical protein
MSRTHRVAARDGGQPLHMNAEQVCERRRLGLTQLREFRRNMRYRAVMLAQLRTGTEVLS